MTRKGDSIEGFLVIFKRIIRKHIGVVTKRFYYKVLAEVETDAGKQQQAYWFAEHQSFLRQRNKTVGKASVKIACNSKQRAEILGLVRTFDLAAAPVS